MDAVLWAEIANWPLLCRWVGLQGQGGWNFMSFCQQHAFISDSACVQPGTAAGAGINGSQLAVSPSYQLTYGSVSFQSPGQWGGITFQKQFLTALKVRCTHCHILGREGARQGFVARALWLGEQKHPLVPPYGWASRIAPKFANINPGFADCALHITCMCLLSFQLPPILYRI